MRRCLPLAAALVALASVTSAQEYIGHMEGCFVWGTANGRLGARNECSRAITMKFMAFDDGHTVEADIPPGGWFDSGSPGGSFMYTSCPVGWMPSLKFSIENKQAISVSLYNCLPGRPNS
jgi:hypothetical protein